jgi:hypothetical protein
VNDFCCFTQQDSRFLFCCFCCPSLGHRLVLISTRIIFSACFSLASQLSAGPICLSVLLFFDSCYGSVQFLLMAFDGAPKQLVTWSLRMSRSCALVSPMRKYFSRRRFHRPTIFFGSLLWIFVSRAWDLVSV